MNEIKEQNKWRNNPCAWIRTLNIVKMSLLPDLPHPFVHITSTAIFPTKWHN